jgi:predicted ArsR family transcriptional regulator
MRDPLTALPELETMKVLADDTRHALFVALRDSASPLTTRELADLVGLHPNTVRPHLDRLRQVGLVEADTSGHGQVGRPRHVFRVAGPADPDPASTSAITDACVEAVVDHARRLGFQPACSASDDGVTVSFGACPFEDDPDLGLACSLHEGLIEGVVEHFGREAGGADRPTTLEQFLPRSSGQCRADLRVGSS